MHQAAEQGQQTSPPGSPWNPGAPHPAFSLTLLCAPHAVSQFEQEGAKKADYPVQEARPFPAPLGVPQGTNTLLSPIFPKSSTHLSRNSEPKWPFLRQTNLHFQAPTDTQGTTPGPTTTWVSASNSRQKAWLPKGGSAAARQEEKQQRKTEQNQTARSPELEKHTVEVEKRSVTKDGPLQRTVSHTLGTCQFFPSCSPNGGEQHLHRASLPR